MFVRRKNKVNRTQTFEHFPEDFDKLGLKVTEDLRVVQKEDGEPFRWAIGGKTGCNDERSAYRNDCRREAVDECLRRWTIEQLDSLGLVKHHHPEPKSPSDAHTTVLYSPNAFKSNKPLAIICPPPNSDLGIISKRQMTDSMEYGSTLPFIRACLAADYEVLLLNPGQTIWDPIRNRTISETTWKVTSPIKPYLLRKANHIPDSSTVDEHLNLFLGPNGFVLNRIDPSRKVLFLGFSFTNTPLTNLLSNHWDQWQPHVASLALLEPSFPKRKLAPPFRQFLVRLARAYIVYAGVSLFERIDDLRFGCATHSGDESDSDKMMCRPELVDEVVAYFNGCLEDPDKVNLDVMVECDEGLVELEELAEKMRKKALQDALDREGNGWGVNEEESLEKKGYVEIPLPKGINIDDPKYDEV